MAKSFFQRFGPPALARGLWGNRPMPTHYKVLFAGQGLIFCFAMFIRTKDVERAKQLKQLAEAGQTEGVNADEPPR
ncbi:hypothetical protein ACHAXT_005265 [Thalassiosira profunda]